MHQIVNCYILLNLIHKRKITLEMNNNKIIESTDKNIYLGILLHACTLNNDTTSTVRDFNIGELKITC